MSLAQMIMQIMQNRQMEQNREMQQSQFDKEAALKQQQFDAMLPYYQAHARQLGLSNDAAALQLQQDAELRSKLGAAQPQTVTTMTPAPRQPATMADLIGSGIPSGMAGLNNYKSPPPRPLTGSLESELAANGLSEGAPETVTSPFSLEGNKPSDLVSAYKDGRISSKTTQPDYAGIMAQTRLMQGRPDDAKKAIDLDNALQQHAARTKLAGGDLSGFYANQAKLDIYKEMLGTISPLLKNASGRAIASQMLDQYQQTYPSLISGVDLNNFGMEGEKPFYDMKDEKGNVIGRYFRNPESGNLEFHPPAAIENIDLKFEKQRELDDKRQDRQDARQERGIAAADARQARQIEAVNSRQTGKPSKVLPANALEGLADATKLIQNLEEAAGMSKKVSTGPVAGRVQAAGAVVGAAPKDFVNFRQKIATVNNIMLKLRSGAAVTDQEYARFLQEMPTVNDPPETRDIKLSNALSYAKSLQTEKIANYEEGGYKVPERLTNNKPNKQPPAKTNKPKTAADYLSKW